MAILGLRSVFTLRAALLRDEGTRVLCAAFLFRSAGLGVMGYASSRAAAWCGLFFRHALIYFVHPREIGFVIYHAMGRPRHPSPSASAERKRRQMARLRAGGGGIVLLTPNAGTLKDLHRLAEFTGGTLKGEAEMIVRRGVRTALEEAQKLAVRFGPIYALAKPYLPYAPILNRGESFRVKARVLQASDWRPLADQLAVFHDWARRQGWSRSRADRFLRRAAGERVDPTSVPAQSSASALPPAKAP